MRISTPPYIGMAEKFIDAARELGYPRVDLNGKYNGSGNLITIYLRC